MNPYHVLEVAANAEFEVIRASYRRLVRLHHPDCAPDEAARVVAAERMVKINWAWHIVSDQARRAAFDSRLKSDQIESARHQQEALRARGQVARGQQAHLSDILNAQAQRRQSHSRQRHATEEQKAREQQFLEWQALERERQQQQARAKQNATRARQAATRATRQPLSREEKKRRNLESARVRHLQRENKKRGANPSARRQLAEAARLFGQEGRASEAIAICHDVLRVDFRNVPARELLGDFYLQLGRQDRALPLWEQALVLQPDNSSVRRKLNALRPHDPKSYQPQPRITRPVATQNERAQAPKSNFWGRLRNALRSGL